MLCCRAARKKGEEEDRRGVLHDDACEIIGRCARNREDDGVICWPRSDDDVQSDRVFLAAPALRNSRLSMDMAL